MNIQSVKIMAKNLGIKTGKMKKEDIIRSIQIKEGNFPCFQSATDHCDHLDCCWIKDCLRRNGGKK